MSTNHSQTSGLLNTLTALFVNAILLGGLTVPISVLVAKAGIPDVQGQWVTAQEHIVALRNAIVGQESGANYQAVNPHSGALGYGQIMPANLPSWSYEALGYSVSQTDFLNSPEIQLRIIDYKLNEYWQNAMITSGGNEAIAVRQVAAHWYSGNPARYNSTTPQYYRGHRYPSIAEYSFSVLQRYQDNLEWISANPNSMILQSTQN